MNTRRPLLRIAAVAVAATLAVGLSGCGDVNAGTAAIEKLHAVVDGWEETVGVEDSASNTLPWMGDASATVVVDDATTDERLEEMTEELGAFLEESEGGTAAWRGLDLQVGGFRFGIALDPTRRAQRFAAVDELRSDDRVVGGFVWADDHLVSVDDDEPDAEPSTRILDDTKNTVRAIVGDDVPLTEAYEIARSAADLVTELDESAVVAESEDGLSAVSDSEGPTGGTQRSGSPEVALDLAATIDTSTPVVDAVATSDSLDIRLETSAAVASVREEFGDQAIGLGIDLTVNGGVVTDDGTAPPEVVDVAQALDGVEGVRGVDVTGSTIAVMLADGSTVSTIVEAILDQPTISAVSEVSLSAPADGGPAFDVSAAPEDLERMGELVVAASTQPTITRLSGSTDAVTLELAENPDIESLRSVVSAVRPRLADGADVTVMAARDGGFTVDVHVVVADELDIRVEQSGDDAAELAALLATAWATAP